MDDNRQAVAEAVLFGDLDPDYLTDDEVKELATMVAHAAFEMAVQEAMDAGKVVFSGVDGDTLQ